MDRGRAPDLVTLGEVMALFLAESAAPLGVADRFRLGAAGAEATVAVGLSRLGHRAAYVGRVGRDELGHGVLRSLRAEDVDVTHVRLDEARTGILVRDAPAARPVSVAYRRDASAGSRLDVDDVPDDLVRTARMLHVTGLTAVLSATAEAAVRHAVAVAREAGVPVCLDPNVRHSLAPVERWREVITALAGSADVVLTGADEARVVTDGDPAAWFLDRGARHVVVKDGARGARETDGTLAFEQPAMPCVPVDVVGAGDAFAAGWISGWLRDEGPGDRLRRGAAVAAQCVAVAGDLPGLPHAAELDRVLASTPDVER